MRKGEFYSDEIDNKKIVDYSILKRLFKYFKPYTFTLVFSVSLLILVSFTDLIGPYLFKISVDNYIPNHNIPGLKFIVLLYLLFTFFTSFVSYLQMIITQKLGQNVVFDIRTKLYKHLMYLSMNTYNMNPIGRLTTRVTNDVESLNQLFSAGFIGIMGDVLTLLFIIIIITVKLDVRLTLVSLAILPVLIFAIAVFRRAIQPVYLKIRKSLASLNANLGEMLGGMKVIKSFVETDRMYKKLKDKNREYREYNKKSVFIYAVFHPTVSIIQAIAQAFIIWYGGYRILHLSLSPGILIAFLMYIQRIYRPINDLAQKFNLLQNAISSSARIFKLLDSNDTIDNSGENENIKGETIEFKNVNFSYGKEDIIKNFSLKIKKGEKIAIVGYTGSGKTTIINLLLRFWDIDKGKILIDNNSIKDFKLRSLRKKFGLVPQDIYLFEGTIYDNIVLGNKNIPREKVIQACNEVGLTPVLKKFENGIDHEITGSGTNMSLGERQLISFTRVLIYNPDILILDEPTSNIDTQTEQLIQKALNKVLVGRTAIMIAHRLSTIKNAERIVVIDHGEIIETGSHSQLIKKKGIYYKLYLAQS